VKGRSKKITNLPQSFPMDLCPNQTNKVSYERSKWKGKEPLIMKIHKRHFKETVHRLTGSTQGHRFHMSHPPPLVVSSPQPSVSRITTQPYRFPTVPSTTDAVITSTVESLNTQPPSPPYLPPSPPSHREQELVEPRVDAISQVFENNIIEDDMNHEQLHGSTLPPLFANGDENPQHENIPPSPVPAISPSIFLVQPNSPNNQGSENITPSLVLTSSPFGSFEWLLSPNNLQTENILQPPVPTTLPFESLDQANSMNDLLSEDIPPPVMAPSPYGSLYWQVPDSLNGPLSPSLIQRSPTQVPETSQLWSVDWPNPLNDIRPENVPPLVPAASPLWSLDWSNFPNYLQPENVPPLVPATSPSMSLDWPNFQNTPPPVPAGSPLWSLDGLNYPNYLQPENVPPLVPGISPLEWSNSQNNLPLENVPPLVPATSPLIIRENTPPPVPVTSPLGNLEWPFDRSIYLT
ncbi:unnamed protein product, partial [Arabidopsis halleri]